VSRKFGVGACDEGQWLGPSNCLAKVLTSILSESTFHFDSHIARNVAERCRGTKNWHHDP
jgi:hypothetical protein